MSKKKSGAPAPAFAGSDFGRAGRRPFRRSSVHCFLWCTRRRQHRFAALIQFSDWPVCCFSDVGLTSSIGAGLFTSYLLPFEIHFDTFVDGYSRRDHIGAAWRLVTGSRRSRARRSSLFQRTSGSPLDLRPDRGKTHTTDAAAQLLGVERTAFR